MTPFFSIKSSIALFSLAAAGIDSEAQTAATAMAIRFAFIVVVVFFM
jgi:Na+/melibiose symporter-like transporter